MKSLYPIFFFLMLFLTACSDSSTENIENLNTEITYDWTVSKLDLIGTFNPFPLVENPTMVSVTSANGLNDEDIVVAVSYKEKIKIYPLNHIHSYEIINDNLDGIAYTISFCPITQSVININRNLNNNELTFRASGILYRENVVMHEKESNSFWSQILLKNIKGPLENEILNTLPMVETTWETAKNYFPNATVYLSTNNIFLKNSISKPLEIINTNERVFGVINNIQLKSSDVFIFQYKQFNDSIQIINKGKNTGKIIIGSKNLHFITSFLNETDNVFTPIQNEFPTIMKDNLNNKWNVFGIAVSGPNKGESLKETTNFVASWWAWEAFYENFSF